MVGMTITIYTVDEVTKILRLKNRRTVQNWLKDGKLKGFKAGKEWRITESALNDFIVGNTAKRKNEIMIVRREQPKEEKRSISVVVVEPKHDGKEKGKRLKI